MERENPYQSPLSEANEETPAKAPHESETRVQLIPETFLAFPALVLLIPGVGMTFGGLYDVIEITLHSRNPTLYGRFWDGLMAFPVGVCLLTISFSLFWTARLVMRKNWRAAGRMLLAFTVGGLATILF